MSSSTACSKTPSVCVPPLTPRVKEKSGRINLKIVFAKGGMNEERSGGFVV
jgi:hypothetical protein